MQNQLWQNKNTQIIWQKIFFFLFRKRSNSLYQSGGTSGVWGKSLSCAHLSWSSRAHCSLFSQSQAYWKRQCDRMSLQEPPTANHLHPVSDRETDGFQNMFPNEEKEFCLIISQNFIFTCLIRTTTPCSRLISLLDIHLLLFRRALETFS